MAEPELFKCTPKDDGCHPDETPDFFEWWYFDALMDDESSFVISWHRNAEGPAYVRFTYHDPAGEKSHLQTSFPLERTHVSAETCDVRMADNYLRGEYPKWEMRFQHGDTGCDLMFRSVTQSVKSPPDGVSIFSERPRRYLGWLVPQPRAEVTGEVTVRGKRFPVHGLGYHDHNWGVGHVGRPAAGQEVLEAVGGGLAGLYDFWYWGRLYLPRHTIVYSAGRMAEHLGYAPANILIALQGEKLTTMSFRLGHEERGMSVEPTTGADYPQELIIRPQHRLVNGQLTLKLRRFIDISPYGERGHGYFRFLADCHAQLDFCGEKIDIVVPAIHERMKP